MRSSDNQMRSERQRSVWAATSIGNAQRGGDEEAKKESDNARRESPATLGVEMQRPRCGSARKVKPLRGVRVEPLRGEVVHVEVSVRSIAAARIAANRRRRMSTHHKREKACSHTRTPDYRVGQS